MVLEIGDRAIWQSKDPAFNDRLHTAAQWISDCDSYHAACKENIQVKPRRLLDLTLIEETDRVRLVSTADITGSIRYATLSHCWGPQTSKPPLQTDHFTLQAHLQGISISELTQNFRDAVTISRKFGLDYLWIDSLCIIQNDKADWEIEAANMANIYRGGYINIAATASEDAHGGIISLASVSSETHCTRIHPSTSGVLTGSARGDDASFMIRESLDHKIQRQLSGSNYRYLTRGWVLQELALSPRTVHFPKGQLLWQCRHCFTSEDGTFWSSSLMSLANGSYTAGSFNFSSLRSSRNLWWQWIESYSTRDLTFETDVGPAIAGLVSFFQERTNLTPVLGLWLETLAVDLHWGLQYRKQSRPPPLEPRESEFPSWSWLSVLPQQDADFSVPGQYMTSSASLHINFWEVKWANLAFTSGLMKSQLIVSSFVRNATINVPTPATWTAASAYRVSVLGEPSWRGVCKLQYLFPEETSQSVTLLQLFQENTGRLIIDRFLVLLPQRENRRHFYRIGTGDVQTPLSEATIDGEERTVHLDLHFSELDRQTLLLV